MKIGAYARYSTDRQKKTSVDDQLLVCDDLAVNQLGGEVHPRFIFADEARSGGVKDKYNRDAYERLLEAIANRDIDALVVDEVSRLGRNPAQHGQFEELVEESGIRLVTGDGVDSSIEGWQLLYQLRAMISAQQLRSTRHWTGRSMRGRLERGYMIAHPPFGYGFKRIFDAIGDKLGTIWTIKDDEAPIIREIFELSSQGMPLGEIAKMLNERGVPTPRKSRKNGCSYWRPGSIHRILHNTIYRGVFTWHGSHAIVSKAKKQKKDPGTLEFDRPELRLVDDETWFICNRKKVSRTGRGGGRHPFAGLVNCGTCDAVLTVCTGGSSPTLYCAQCQQARRVSAVKQERGGYLSVSGLQEILLTAVKYLFSEKVVTAFKERLHERLTGNNDDEIARLKIKLDRIDRGSEQLVKLIRNVDDDGGYLDTEYRSVIAERKEIQKKLNKLESGKAAVDKKAIKKQLSIDPKELLGKLFESNIPPARLRALFCRIFTEIVFESKPERHVAIVRVKFSPGVVAAVLSDTEPVDTSEVSLRFRLSIGSWNPTVWRVDLLPETPEIRTA